MFLKPKAIIQELSSNFFIKNGDKIAEFGCGSGYFTSLLAEKVGPEGRIFAIDILENAINETKELIELLGFNNVVFHQGNVKNLPYEDNFFDVVFISQILFQNEDYEKILDEGLRILKPGGYMVVLEPAKKLPFLYGTPVSLESIRSYFQVKNLKIEFQKLIGDNYYLIVVKK